MGDLTNGTFEALGALVILLSVRRVLKDKAVAGISVPHVVFFNAWGFWNLYYYPSLDQWFSFAAGVALVAANTLWVGLLIKYRRRKSDKLTERSLHGDRFPMAEKEVR